MSNAEANYRKWYRLVRLGWLARTMEFLTNEQLFPTDSRQLLPALISFDNRDKGSRYRWQNEARAVVFRSARWLRRNDLPF